MAISASSVFEVRTGGTDTNGGGFVTGAAGTDYSQQNSKNANGGTDGSSVLAAAAGSTTITCSDAQFGTTIVGNIVYFTGGTGSITAQWRQVTARASTTSITIDAVIASSTGMTMNVGGALASPGQASALMPAGNIAYVQNTGADGNSVYSITSASTAVAAGVVSSSNNIAFQGYTSTRSLGNTDNRPTIQLNVSTATMWNGSGILAQGFVCDGNSQTASKPSANALFVRCMFKNFNTSPTGTGNGFTNCAATTNSATIFVGSCTGCEAYANTASGFAFTSGLLGITNCISSGNTGASSDGFVATGAENYFANCIAISNGRDGFRAIGGVATSFINCHSESNTSNGYLLQNSSKVMINCSYYNNGTDLSTSGSVSNTGSIAVTAGSVFVNVGSNNYALNSTTNQGALLRAAGDPATYPRGLTSNYRDIGVAQHQDPIQPLII